MAPSHPPRAAASGKKRQVPWTPKQKMYWVLGAGGVIILLTAGFLYPRPPQPGQENYRFMHCPHCGTELAYNPVLLDQPCSRCMPERHLWVPTTHSIAGGRPPSPFGGLAAVLMFEVVVLMGVVVFVSTPRPAPVKKVEDYMHMRCRKCQRKLRFASHKAGQPGKCPQCHAEWLFPEEDTIS